MSEPTPGNDPDRRFEPEAAPTDHPTEPFDTTPADARTEPLADTAASAWTDFDQDGSTVDPDSAAVPAERRGVPLGTLVFGLVVVALGLLILVSVFYGITLSGSAVAIALFLGAGLVLVVGGVVAARRSSSETPTRP